MAPRDPKGRGSRPGSARERAAQMRAEQRRAEQRRSMLVKVGAVAVVLLIVVGVAIAILAQRNDSGTVAGDGTPPGLTDDGAVRLGAEDAPVTVQVVEDFQCPVCQAFEAQAGAQLDEWIAGDEVAVEYRGVAFLDRASSTQYSSRALNASACVATESPDAWPQFHSALYEQQPPEGGAGLTDEQITAIATQAGADASVGSCISDLRYADWIASTTEAAASDGVQGTPTIFVNGEQLEGFQLADVQAAVEEAQG